MKCSVCGKPVILSPTAAERSQRFGQPPSYFTNIFTTHSTCMLMQREADVINLMRRLKAEPSKEVRL